MTHPDDAINDFDATNPSPGRLGNLTAKAAQLLPAAQFGMRVAALAGVALGAGLIAADLTTAVNAVTSANNTTCCIIIPPNLAS